MWFDRMNMISARSRANDFAGLMASDPWRRTWRTRRSCMFSGTEPLIFLAFAGSRQDPWHCRQAMRHNQGLFSPSRLVRARTKHPRARRGPPAVKPLERHRVRSLKATVVVSTNLDTSRVVITRFATLLSGTKQPHLHQIPLDSQSTIEESRF